jgi:hypothetical protein
VVSNDARRAFRRHLELGLDRVSLPGAGVGSNVPLGINSVSASSDRGPASSARKPFLKIARETATFRGSTHPLCSPKDTLFVFPDMQKMARQAGPRPRA